MEQTTITVDEPTLRRFKQLKDDLDEQQPDVPNHTADTFLHALMDTWEAADEGYYSEPSADAIAEQLKDELSMVDEPTADVDVDGLVTEIDRLKEMVERVPERAADQFERKYR